VRGLALSEHAGGKQMMSLKNAREQETAS